MRPLAVAVAAVALLAFAPAAAAETLCVNTPDATGCDGTPYTAAQLQTALADAAGDADRDTVRIGPGTYDGLVSYSSPNPVDIVGSGQATKIRSTGLGDGGLSLRSVPSTVQNLTLQAGVDNSVALLASAGTVQDAWIETAPGVENARGGQISSDDVTVRRVTVDVDGGSNGLQTIDAGSPVIEDSVIDATSSGIEVNGPSTAVVRRVRINGGHQAAHAVFGGTLTITDSLLLVPGQGAGLAADDNNNLAGDNTSTVNADRVTIAGIGGEAGKKGVEAVSAGAGDVMTVNVRNSVLVGVDRPVRCWRGNPAAGVATVNFDRSHHPAFADPTPTFSDTRSCSTLTDTNRVTGPTAFVDSSSADYRLRHGSALIDAGDATPAQSGATDRNGVMRGIEGDGAGTAAVDLGAFEYPRRAPSASAAAAPSSPGQAAFSGTGSDPDPGDTLTYSWSFDDGGSASGANVTHTFATAGQHTGTVTVADPSGLSATATATVTVTAARAGDGSNGTTADTTPATTATTPSDTTTSPLADTLAPALTGVGVTPRAFRLGPQLPVLGARPGAARIAFSLDEPATVTLRFERILPGRRSASGCVAPNRARRGRPCKRYQPAGTRLRFEGASGANVVAFAGRFSARKALRPGSYRLTADAVDAAGNAARPAVATFKLLPARRARRAR